MGIEEWGGHPSQSMRPPSPGGSWGAIALAIVVLASMGRGIQLPDLTADVIELNDATLTIGGGMGGAGSGLTKEVVTVPVSANATNASYTPITKGLGPRIFGGTQGELVFTVIPVNRELGESGDKVIADKVTAASTKPGIKLAKPASDKANKNLFDLKPLYMGIQADRKRRRGVFGKCITSMNELVLSKICKPGKMAQGKCMEYTLPPMSVAMQTIYRNVRTNYCKYNTSSCDTTLCYTYPGPTDPKSGLPTAQHHNMVDYPIWIEHNQTVKNNQTVAINTTAFTQIVSFKMELEKVGLCEKINPPVETVDGNLKTLNCYTSRRCKMTELTRKHCYDASSSMTPAPKVECPKDTLFAAKRRSRENAVTALLCSQI